MNLEQRHGKPMRKMSLVVYARSFKYRKLDFTNFTRLHNPEALAASLNSLFPSVG
jgi:hypothetical protein